MEDADPLAAMRARYQRHERQPIPRFIAAAKDAGCTVSRSRTPCVDYEIGLGGMCIGTITVEKGVNVMELSRRETPTRVLDAVSASIERQSDVARRNMAAMNMGIQR